jgi:branched-chain amino acid aminotransferase
MLQKYDPKNANLKVFVGDRLMHRDDAKVSVFDSSVQGGDAVWEGLRLYPKGVLHLHAHLDRLFASAHALAFEGIPTKAFVVDAIKQTFEANGMHSDAHVRLTLTRGAKVTSGMDPRLNQSGCCLIVLAEWKPLVYDNNEGIRVITSSQRRNGPQFLDSKIHHNNLLNNIIAKIQANVAGVNAAIMLDDRGCVSELNDTNVFIFSKGTLYTPHATSCLPGISRQMTMDVANSIGVPVLEKDLTLVDCYNADYFFASGTMGQLTPIHESDGRKVGNSAGKADFERLVTAYAEAIPKYCTAL